MKNITLTIVFEGSALNRDEKLGGNILSIKKMNVNGKIKSYIGKPAIRHYLFETLNKLYGWGKTKVLLGQKDVIQFDLLNESILSSPELDTFGYMYTVKDEGAFTRKSPLGITKAISVFEYEQDLGFYGNHDLVKRAVNQGLKASGDKLPSPDPYNKEEHTSFYKLSFTLDTSILGIDEWIVSEKPNYLNDTLIIKIGDKEKKLSCRVLDENSLIYSTSEGNIHVDQVNSKTYNVKYILNKNFKLKRITQILTAIKNGLYAQSSGEANTIVPLFMIASGVKVPSPVFHSYIDIKKEDGKVEVIGINDCIANGWVDGKVYLKGSERIPISLYKENIEENWNNFLTSLYNSESENESSEN